VFFVKIQGVKILREEMIFLSFLAIMLGFSEFSSSCKSSEPSGPRNCGANGFLCAKSNECIAATSTYRHRSKGDVTLKFLCDGRCQCERSLCEDENEACPIDGPWDINSYPSEYPQYYKGYEYDPNSHQACTGREPDETLAKLMPMFQCQNGRCVGESDECNGWDDCGDGSDEKNCWSSGDCIVKISEVCDGVHQCRFNVDEGGC